MVSIIPVFGTSSPVQLSTSRRISLRAYKPFIVWSHILLRTLSRANMPGKANHIWGPLREGTWSLVPLNKIGIFPCSPKSKSWFSMFPDPQIAFAPMFPSVLDLFPCSPEINDLIPLFSKTRGRTSYVNPDSEKQMCRRGCFGFISQRTTKLTIRPV